MENNLKLRLADSSDVAEIYNMMKTVYDGLENKELFVCDDMEFVKLHIQEKGFIVVACEENGDMAGCFIFRYPGLDEDNLGRDIGLEDSCLTKVVHMESAAVMPKFRGLRLQYKMLKFGEDCIDKEKYRYFLATVSPDNPASAKTLEKAGFENIITKKKYGGLLRMIYCKYLK